jgi:hypothetical protein
MSDPVFIESALGRERGAPTDPLVLLGPLATRALGELIAGHSTLCCALLQDVPSLERLLQTRDVVALVAQSAPERPGEAGLAIAAVRRLRPDAAAIYQAWDYHVERGARRALEYGADGVLMPAIDVNEMFAFVLGVLRRRSSGTAPPTTVEEHVALVRQLAPTSKFWGMQDLIVSEYH